MPSWKIGALTVATWLLILNVKPEKSKSPSGKSPPLKFNENKSSWVKFWGTFPLKVTRVPSGGGGSSSVNVNVSTVDWLSAKTAGVAEKETTGIVCKS
jgi:hypothetical protein